MTQQNQSLPDRFVNWLKTSMPQQMTDQAQQHILEDALKIEKYARQLNGISPEQSSSLPTRTEDVLSAARILLQRFIERQAETAATDDGASLSEITTATRVAEKPAEHALHSVATPVSVTGTVPAPVLPATAPVALTMPPVAAPVATPVTAQPTPTLLIGELISVRDWLLLSCEHNEKTVTDFAVALYDRLGKAMEKAGVEILAGAGPFDYERQQVMMTKPTSEISLNETVAETVRPGYLFQQALLRPQEVVVYLYQESQRG